MTEQHSSGGGEKWRDPGCVPKEVVRWVLWIRAAGVERSEGKIRRQQGGAKMVRWSLKLP